MGSGVWAGAEVGVGGTDGGVGVLVARMGPGVSVGSAVGVAVGPSPHADSKAAASKHKSPNHAVRRTYSPNTPLTREVIANRCSLDGLAAKLVNARSYCTVGAAYWT